MIKLKVACYAGDKEFELPPEDLDEMVRKIESGEVEEIPKGRYYIYDSKNKKVIAVSGVVDGQQLVMAPVIAGG